MILKKNGTKYFHCKDYRCIWTTELHFKKSVEQYKIQNTYKKNVFLLYSPRKFTIEPATSEKIDTEVSAFLPKNSKGYITSKFRTDEINELFCAKYCLWIEILNKSFEGNIEIEKGQRIDFFVVEPENLKFQHVLFKVNTKKVKKSYISKNKKTDRRLFKSL